MQKKKNRDEAEYSLKLDLDSKAQLVTLALPRGGEWMCHKFEPHGNFSALLEVVIYFDTS